MTLRTPLPLARRAAAALAFGAACALLPAQRREPVRGAAVTAAGEPWAAARVQLVSRPVPDDDRFGEPDVQQAVSDGKGRFEVALLPGRRYRAWAYQEHDDGTYAASRAVADVRAGLPLELLAEPPRAPVRVQVDGLAPWRARGTITCTLLARDGVLLTRPCDEHDGGIVLPPFPGRRAALEICCDGQPLLPWPAPLDLTSAAVQTITIEPPRPVRFRCVDRAKRPVAGAAYVAADLNGRHASRELATSGDDGTLTAMLPLRPDRAFAWVNYPMQLLAPGRAPRSWIATFRVPADHDGSEPLLTFVLDDGRSLRSRVFVGDEPLARGQLRVVDHMASADGTPDSTHECARAVPLGEDGAFAVDVGPRSPAVLSVFPPPTVLATLPHADGFPLHPEVVVAAVARGDATPLPERIDLLRLAALDVQVLGADGAPADGAEVGVVLPGAVQQRLLAAATDRSGRVCLLLPPAPRLTLCCWTDDGVAVTDVAAADLRAPLRPRLQAVGRRQGRVVDGKGAPVAFADVVWFVGQSPQGGVRSAALAECLGYCVRSTTDARGAFAMPMYAGLHYVLSRVQTADDDHYVRGPEFTAGTDEPAELVIDLSAHR